MEILRQKNVATRIVFPIVDADGDLVTGASSLDSEIDTFTDGANPDGFTDCTNEATEIGTTGIYYLNLTQTEMNNDYIVVQVKTATAGAKTQVILIQTIVGDFSLLATTDDGGAINVASGIVEAQVKSIDNNAITANSIATDAITAAKIAADAIGASELAADAVTEIQSGLSTLTQANIRTAVGLASANLDTQLSAIDDYIDSEVSAIKAKTDQLTFTTANRVDSTVVDKTEFSLSAAGIQAIWDALTSALTTVGSIGKLLVDNINSTISSRASQTSVDTVDDFLDTEIAAIKAKTDNLPSDPADASDIASSFSTVNTKLDAIDDYVDSEVAAVKAVTDKLDTAMELDGAVYRFTTNALEQAPSGGGGGPTVAQIADAVWDERIDDHLNDRSFGAKIGIHLPVVAPDFDYRKIKEIVSEIATRIDQMPQPEKVDLIPISEGLQDVIQEIRDLPKPKDPEKADYSPILKRLDTLINDVRAIEIPEPEALDLSPVLNKIDDTPNGLNETVEQMAQIIERIRDFFSKDMDDIKEEVGSIRKDLKRIPMIVMSPQAQEDEPKKKSVLDDYLIPKQ